MKNAIIFILLCCFSSCTLLKESKCDRLIRKVKEKCADCVEIKEKKVKVDSTIAEQTVTGDIDIPYDSSGIKSLVSEFGDSLKLLLKEHDKTKLDNEILNSQVEELTSRLEKKLHNNSINQKSIPDPVEFDTLDVKGKIWQDGRKIKYSFTKKKQEIHIEKSVPQTIFNCPDKPFWKDQWFWWFIGTLTILILILIKGATR